VAPFLRLMRITSRTSTGALNYDQGVDAWGRIKDYSQASTGGSTYHAPRYAFVLYAVAALLVAAAVAVAVTRAALWPLALARAAGLAAVVAISVIAADFVISVRTASLGDLEADYSVGAGAYLIGAGLVLALISLGVSTHIGRLRRRFATQPLAAIRPRPMPMEGRLATGLPWLLSVLAGVGGCFLPLWQWKARGNGYFEVTGLGTAVQSKGVPFYHGIVGVPFVAWWAVAAILMVIGIVAMIVRPAEFRLAAVGLYGAAVAGLTCWLMLLGGQSFKSYATPGGDYRYTYENGARLAGVGGAMAIIGALVVIAVAYFRSGPFPQPAPGWGAPPPVNGPRPPWPPPPDYRPNPYAWQALDRWHTTNSSRIGFARPFAVKADWPRRLCSAAWRSS
jgi:hypothetical protein